VISIILPTIRPHLIREALRSIPPACGNLPFEVVVVADFPDFELSELPYVLWILQERRGVVQAACRGFAEAVGEYVFLFNDESVLEPFALEVLRRQEPENQILSPEHHPPFNFVYYGRTFLPFPFGRRRLFERLGGLLDPIYRGFYADPDLSLRALAQGVELRTVPGSVLRHVNRHDAPHMQAVSRFLESDRATFRARWDHLGEFCDP
jgi:glycosyltransferase involved in cell wall biosynthesis